MRIICSVEGCERRAIAHGLCQKHYMRWRRHGDAGLGTRPEDWGERERHPLYQLWSNIKRRCLNENSRQFANYGGRGITLHQPWADDFMVFANDLETEIGPRPSKKHSLDRVDNDGSYEPGNLRWATASEQSSNRRNSHIKPEHHDQIKALRKEGLSNDKIAKQLGLNRDAVRNFSSGHTYSKRHNRVLDLFIPQSRIKPANENTGRVMTCAYEGCDSFEHYGKGYCRKHYKWVFESTTHEARKDRRCDWCESSIPDNMQISARFCSDKCSMKWHRRHGAYTAEAVKETRGTCSIEGCDNPVNAHGMCSRHQMRMWRYGDPHAVRAKQKNFCKCVDDGEECGRPVASQGMCTKHYQRYVVLPKRRAAREAAKAAEANDAGI